jgi:hypothetical protein
VKEGTGRAPRKLRSSPRDVRVKDKDEVGLLDKLVVLTKGYAGVGRVREGEVDGREARLENGDGCQVDELDQLLNRGMVSTEVGGDDQWLLCLCERVGDANDGW